MKPTFPIRSSSSVHQLYIHLIFVVKYRIENRIDEKMETQLKEIFDAECAKLKCTMFAMKSDGDHVHALVRFPPSVPISTLVNRMKGASSYQINEAARERAERDGRRAPGPFWSPSYFVKTIGSKTIDITSKYVDGQRDKDRQKRSPRGYPRRV
jgi:putative transposase